MMLLKVAPVFILALWAGKVISQGGCASCQNGFYLDSSQCHNCSKTCATNASSSLPVCRPTDGRCEFGCQSGYYGAMCDVVCSKNCLNDRCHRLTGGCASCQNGFYLDSRQCHNCSKTCATNDSSSLPVCRPTDGRCEFGCQSGYYGAMCEMMCSKTCRNDRCHRLTGACTEGCILPVLTGPMCQQACRSDCLLRECDQSGACKHYCCSNCVNKKCAFDTGSCLHGCIEGYEGSDCTKPVGSDVDFKPYLIIGASVLGFLVILCLIVCCIRRR